MNQPKIGVATVSAVGSGSTPKKDSIVLMGSGIISPTVKAHLAKTIAQRQAPASKKPIVLTGSGIISPTIKAHLAKQFR